VRVSFVDVPLDALTEIVNDPEPSVTAIEPPAHAGFFRTFVPVSEELRVGLTEEFIKFRTHRGLGFLHGPS
jgi:hypothetical protein